MSVEIFCNRYPAGPNVRRMVGIDQIVNGRSDMSLVVMLAVQLAREGRDEVRKLISKLSPSNAMFEIGGEDFQGLPEEDRRNMIINFAAFVFGNSVVSLERTLIDREYDHEKFCKDYNLAAKSLQLATIEVGTQKRERLLYSQLDRMRFIVEQDRTFSIFFEERGLQGLPHTLRKFLEARGIIPVIQKAILPIYKPRADFLVAQQLTPSHTS